MIGAIFVLCNGKVFNGVKPLCNNMIVSRGYMPAARNHAELT